MLIQLYKSPAIIILTSVITLSGCGLLRYEDVSHEPEFKSLLGRTYVVKAPMLIQGKNMDEYYNAIHIYYIIPINQRSGGPENLSTDLLEIGTEFTLKAVKRSINRPLFSSKEVYVLLESNLKLKTGIPVATELKYINNSNYFDQVDGKEWTEKRSGR
jgi:hypothetical protein